jgi:hypothetical protein
MIANVLKTTCCVLVLCHAAFSFAAPAANPVTGEPVRVEFRGAGRCDRWTPPQQVEQPEWRGRVVIQVNAQLQGGRVKEVDMRVLEGPADLPRPVRRALMNSVMGTIADWRCESSAPLDVLLTFER